MKKLFLLFSVAAMLLIMNSCTTQGYVSSEPTYIEYSRPTRPSNLHIWINGDWVYDRHSQNYVRKNGHWHKPSHSRTYVEGTWMSSSQGLYWQSGYWSR
jgi:hypothetical protein